MLFALLLEHTRYTAKVALRNTTTYLPRLEFPAVHYTLPSRCVALKVVQLKGVWSRRGLGGCRCWLLSCVTDCGIVTTLGITSFGNYAADISAHVSGNRWEVAANSLRHSCTTIYLPFVRGWASTVINDKLNRCSIRIASCRGWWWLESTVWGSKRWNWRRNACCRRGACRLVDDNSREQKQTYKSTQEPTLGGHGAARRPGRSTTELIRRSEQHTTRNMLAPPQ